MSLERELVNQLMDEGNSEPDVLEIVEYMADPNGKGRAVRTNSRKIQVALSQYKARGELKKRGEYKRKFKDELKDLIEKEKREIEGTYPNLLSFRIGPEHSSDYLCRILHANTTCNNCKKDTMMELYAKIKYLNGKGKIPIPQIKKKFLFEYCNRCGDINYKK